MNLVKKYHPNFKQYENKHNGETCYIFGCGPTINNFKPIEEGVYIGCNRVIKNEEIRDKLKYYFFGHMYFNNIISEDGTNNREDVNSLPFSVIKFAVLTLNGKYHSSYGFRDTPRQVEQLVKINAFPCDLTTSHIYKDISKKPLINHSIPFPAVQFALYCGFKKIYIVGCDSSVVYHGGQYNEFWHKSNLSGHKPNRHLIEWWKKIYYFKKIFYPEAKLININPVGLKNLMDGDIYQ